MSNKQEKESFFMPIPAGTPYSIIAEATHKFRVELVEKPIQVPPSAEMDMVPMGWVLVGEREELIKAKEFIYERLREVLKKFE